MQQQSTFITPIRENNGRSKIIIAIFWVLLGFSIIALIAMLNMMTKNDYMDFDAERFKTAAILTFVVGLLQLAVNILAMIFFIMWMRRAYWNLHNLNQIGLRHSEGWAAGAWFVPFLNLAWPYQIMKDIWHYTQSATYVPGTPYNHQPGTLVGWWWAMYLTKNILTNIASRLDFVNDNELTVIYILLVYPFEIVAILLTIQMIKRISGFEDRLFDARKNVNAFMPQQPVYPPVN
jgi:hypothetical protein